MTSTLQQEASRKYGMGAKQCMNAAQRLYEAGHITYMRTDGIDMAPEGVMAARDEIKRRFGPAYVPDSPRIYKNNVVTFFFFFFFLCRLLVQLRLALRPAPPCREASRGAGGRTMRIPRKRAMRSRQASRASAE